MSTSFGQGLQRHTWPTSQTIKSQKHPVNSTATHYPRRNSTWLAHLYRRLVEFTHARMGACTAAIAAEDEPHQPQTLQACAPQESLEDRVQGNKASQTLHGGMHIPVRQDCMTDRNRITPSSRRVGPNETGIRGRAKHAP